jgi:DNA-binding Xre family transcriptional regulator
MKTRMNETGGIKVRVPELLEERDMNTSDLMYGARLAQGTAYRLADGDAEAMTFDVLISLCNFFGVGVGDILENDPNHYLNRLSCYEPGLSPWMAYPSPSSRDVRLGGGLLQ